MKVSWGEIASVQITILTEILNLKICMGISRRKLRYKRMVIRVDSTFSSSVIKQTWN